MTVYQEPPHHPGWGGAVDVDGVEVPFTAHAATDPKTVAALHELVAAAYRAARDGKLPPPGTSLHVPGASALVERIRRQQRGEELEEWETEFRDPRDPTKVYGLTGPDADHADHADPDPPGDRNEGN